MTEGGRYTQCTVTQNGQKLTAWIDESDAFLGNVVSFEANKIQYKGWRVEATGPTLLGVHVAERYGR